MRTIVLSVVMTLGCLAATAGEVTDVFSYPLNTCPVTGEKIGGMGKPVVSEYKGREVRFCCEGCKPKFEAEPDKYLKKIDEAIIAQQKKDYPLDTCVVMGGRLEEGKIVEHVYKNRLVRFCCPGCVTEFEKDPAKYLAKVDEAIVAKQKATYPLDTCVVLGKKLPDKPVDCVVGNRLVRLCCKGCIEKIKENPAEYLSKLDAAKK